MTALVRKFKKIFAKDASNNGVFGSAAALAPATSNNPETIESLPAFLAGWNDATEGGLKLPTLEDMQGLKYDTDYHLAYFYQEGIPEYNSATEYTTNSIVKETGTTKLYKSIALLNTGNPLTDAAKWTLLGDLSNLPATTLGTAAYIDTGVALGNIPLVGTQSSTTSLAGLGLLPSPITIANNVSDANNDIDFSAGVFRFSDGSGQAVGTAMTKRLDATWAAGTNQGGLDTGSKTNDLNYCMFAIYNPTTLASDFLFSVSRSNPTMPSGYTKKCYLGTFRTDASSNIRNGKYNVSSGIYEFTYYTPILDSTGTPFTSAQTISISAPASSKGKFVQYFNPQGSSAVHYGLLSDLSAPDLTPSSSAFSIAAGFQSADWQNQVSAYTEVNLNSSAQLRARFTTTTVLYSILTTGWKEYL